MKTFIRTMMVVTISLLGTVPAWAASERVDHSGFVVWVFLGFCALIIVAQVVPAMLVFFGLVKGAAEKKELAEEKVHK